MLRWNVHLLELIFIFFLGAKQKKNGRSGMLDWRMNQASVLYANHTENVIFKKGSECMVWCEKHSRISDTIEMQTQCCVLKMDSFIWLVENLLNTFDCCSVNSSNATMLYPSTKTTKSWSASFPICCVR